LRVGLRPSIGQSSAATRPPQISIKHKNGQKDQARKTFAAAISSYDWKASKADNHDAWIAHILRREAEALILPDLPGNKGRERGNGSHRGAGGNGRHAGAIRAGLFLGSLLSALVYGYRGLPGGVSLAELLA
jgi:hypothetical protein